MLYVAVDQHAQPLTVSVRNVAGDVILRRQVSTEWGQVRAFWDGIREQSPEGFVVILEVCGLNGRVGSAAAPIPHELSQRLGW